MAGTALGSSLVARAKAAPGDQGIGGTGFSVRPADEDSDRGLGGTGVIGTIRKFGSIVVNDLRIGYPADVTVRIDGRPAAAGDLKLGQVVRVAAASDAKGALSTRTIDVTSEVVGPVEKVTRNGIVVLGQTISTAASRDAYRWSVGDHVAVSGLRRNDGTIAASLIEARDGSLTRVAGPVRHASDGSLRIGALPLSGAGGVAVGERAVVEGERRDGVLAVTKSTSEAALLPRGVRTLSVEAYVERRGDDLRLGSGLRIAGSTRTDFPVGRSIRSVVNATVAEDGRLGIETIRAGNQRYRASPGAGPDRRVPMNFERPGPDPARGGNRGPGGFLGAPGPGAPGSGDPGRFGPRGGFGGGGPGGGRR